MADHPVDGSPLEHPYDRGYWSLETGETEDDVLPSERQAFADGLDQRISETKEAPDGK